MNNSWGEIIEKQDKLIKGWSSFLNCDALSPVAIASEARAKALDEAASLVTGYAVIESARGHLVRIGGDIVFISGHENAAMASVSLAEAILALKEKSDTPTLSKMEKVAPTCQNPLQVKPSEGG